MCTEVSNGSLAKSRSNSTAMDSIQSLRLDNGRFEWSMMLAVDHSTVWPTFSHENGPYTVAKLAHALPSRRLKRDTPRDEVQRVGPARMLFVVCPIQSQPDGRHHR